MLYFMKTCQARNTSRAEASTWPEGKCALPENFTSLVIQKENKKGQRTHIFVPPSEGKLNR